MLSKIFFAWGLMSVCGMIHALGLASAMTGLRRQRSTAQRFWRETWMFIRIAGWIVLLHVIEIGAWAAFYARQGAMPDLHAALYFSAVTYTTTGYGDLLLPRDFQMLGAVEALTGILMCGWSTGFFFAIVGRMFDIHDHTGVTTT